MNLSSQKNIFFLLLAIISTLSFINAMGKMDCPRGSHYGFLQNWTKGCTKNSKYCTSYDQTTKNCTGCAWYTELHNNDFNGDHCKFKMWFVALISILSLGALILISFLTYYF